MTKQEIEKVQEIAKLIEEKQVNINELCLFLNRVKGAIRFTGTPKLIAVMYGDGNNDLISGHGSRYDEFSNTVLLFMQSQLEAMIRKEEWELDMLDFPEPERSHE